MDGILRCERCGGLVKRLREIDQAPCRCEKPALSGRPGKPPRVELEETQVDEDPLELIRLKP